MSRRHLHWTAQPAAGITKLDMLRKPAAAAMEARLRNALQSDVTVTGEDNGVWTFVLDEMAQACTVCGGVHAIWQYTCHPLVGEDLFSIKHPSDSSCHRVYGWQEHSALSKVLKHPKLLSPVVGLLKANLDSRDAELASDRTGFHLCQGGIWRWVDSQVILQSIGHLRPVFEEILADAERMKADADSRAAAAEDDDQEEDSDGLTAIIADLEKAIQRIDSSGKTTILKEMRTHFHIEGFTDSLDRGSGLACSNGILDGASLQLRPSRPEDRITLQIDVNFLGTGMLTPLADKFIGLVLGEASARFLQRVLGCSILGSVDEGVILVLCGGTGE